jgi:hypothetical protein
MWCCRVRSLIQSLLHWIAVVGLCMLIVACDSADADPRVSTVTPVVTPAPGKGIVLGELWEYDRHVPNADGVLYLSDVLTSTQGGVAIASLDAASAPRAYADKQGVFVFNDVQPNEYVLATVTPRGYIFLVDPDTSKQIRLGVKAGEVINLGRVYVDLSAFR